MYLVVFRESVFTTPGSKKRSISKNTFHNVVGLYNNRNKIKDDLLNKFSQDNDNSNFEYSETDCRIIIKFTTAIDNSYYEINPYSFRYHCDSVSHHYCNLGPVNLIRKRFIYEIVNIGDKINTIYSRLNLSY